VSGLNDANVKRLKDVSVASLSARNEAQRCGCIVLQSDDVSVHTRRAILSMYYLQPIPGHKKECSRSSFFGVIYYEHQPQSIACWACGRLGYYVCYVLRKDYSESSERVKSYLIVLAASGMGFVCSWLSGLQVLENLATVLDTVGEGNGDEALSH
jgi:hypothetical protein